MVRVLGDRSGEIESLSALIDEHGAALEYDLIVLGLRLDWLGTDALSWRDLEVIVTQSPSSSALVRSVDPNAIWGLQELLLAEAVDTLHWLQWAKTKDGNKNRNQPKPIPRPGIDSSEYEVIGEAMDMDDLDRALGWAS